MFGFFKYYRDSFLLIKEKRFLHCLHLKIWECSAFFAGRLGVYRGIKQLSTGMQACWAEIQHLNEAKPLNSSGYKVKKVSRVKKMQDMGISLIEVGCVYLAENSQNRESGTCNS